MGLTILSVAYPFAPVSADAAGGAEQILYHLDRALVHRGHRSIVIACAGSRPAGELIPTPRVDGPLTEEARQQVRNQHYLNVCEAVALRKPDVVHLHGIDFLDYLPPPGPRALVTLHLPPSWYPRSIWSLTRPETWLHCVSRSQQQVCPTAPHLLPPIENGVDVDALQMRCRKRDYAFVLGRICPEKNFHMAIDAARLACASLLVAGEVFPYEAHERYFLTEVRPRLDDTRRYIGPVGFRRKRRLITGARCLLLPSLAPETSSLVAMEALACGTPVVAMRSGALPDMIEEGVTGFIVDDVQGMADAIGRVGRIDPTTCRRAAVERFSSHRMIERYLETYQRLARRESMDLLVPGGYTV